VTELGTSEGWRCGRRGGVLIDRVEAHVRLPGSVPLPRELDGIDLTVLDTGWTTRELDASTADARGCWVASQPARVEVMVARSQTLALGQTEAVLAGPRADSGAGRGGGRLALVGPGVRGRGPAAAPPARGGGRGVHARTAGQGAARARPSRCPGSS